MSYTEKQLQIMETAEMLFADQGFHGTSVRDIAEKASVNLAMISYYFGSKDKLLEAIFDYRGEVLKLTLEDILKKPGLTALEKVYLMVDHYVNKIMKQQCFYKVMTREQVVNSTGNTAKLILAMKKRNLEIISRLIHDGQKNGEFRKNIDIPMMMTTMVGTANNLVSSKQYYKELSNLQDLPDEEFESLIHKKLNKHLKLLFKTILTHEI